MTLKDITSRVIGYTNTTKDMNGIIIPIIDDGVYFAHCDYLGNTILAYDTYYEVDNAHDFIKEYMIDFMCDIEKNKDVYYLFIPKFEVEYIDTIFDEIFPNLDSYKKYKQLYNFLKDYDDEYKEWSDDDGYYPDPDIDKVNLICAELDEIIRSGHQENDLTVLCYGYGRYNDIKIIEHYDKYNVNDYYNDENNLITLYSFNHCNLDCIYLQHLEYAIKNYYSNIHFIKINLKKG